MTPLEQYFGGHILVINLERRVDRWRSVQAQFAKYGITTATKIRGVDRPLYDGKPNGNLGCVMSHRKALDLIVDRKWERTLILEDDVEFLHTDFMFKFQRMVAEVPDDWQMLYLAGHFAEPPIARVSPHVVRIGRMLTTSSYGVSLDMARILQPHTSGVGPIDSLYGGFHREHRCYITDPRLAVQYPNKSDLQDREMDNSACMLDRFHIRMV